MHDEIRVHLALSPRLIRAKKPCFRRAAAIRDDRSSIPAPLNTGSSDCPVGIALGLARDRGRIDHLAKIEVEGNVR
jgi:hypothetical protein